MVSDPSNLIWIDLEMTGLNPATDQIIEIATVVTDVNLSVLGEGPVIAIHQPDEILDRMDDWNKTHHGESGLLERVKSSRSSVADAESATIEFLSRHVPPGKSPMCGNSICQDRRFMARFMPELESYFHYRHIDVSTVKELCARWHPRIASQFSKATTHRALQDIHDSIAELIFYRDQLFVKS